MRTSLYTTLAVSWFFLLTGCSKTPDSGKDVITDTPGKTKGQATVPVKGQATVSPGTASASLAKDDRGQTKGQTDDPETIRKEVRDILSGSKKGSAETLDARKKRIESITREAIDEWTSALKTSREEAFTFLMNYDRLYNDNTFQKAESDKVRKLYEGSK